MSNILEIEKLALGLSERERAALAANLLDSLPPILSDEDEGVAEALRRYAESEATLPRLFRWPRWTPKFRAGRG